MIPRISTCLKDHIITSCLKDQFHNQLRFNQFPPIPLFEHCPVAQRTPATGVGNSLEANAQGIFHDARPLDLVLFTTDCFPTANVFHITSLTGSIGKPPPPGQNWWLWQYLLSEILRVLPIYDTSNRGRESSHSYYQTFIQPNYSRRRYNRFPSDTNSSPGFRTPPVLLLPWMCHQGGPPHGEPASAHHYLLFSMCGHGSRITFAGKPTESSP